MPRRKVSPRRQEESPISFLSEPLALLALLCVAAGVLVGILLPAGPRRWSGMLLGALAAVFLLLLRSKINNDAVKEGQGMFQVTFGIGYWLAVFASGLAAVFNAAFARRSPAVRIESPPMESHAPVPPNQSGY